MNRRIQTLQLQAAGGGQAPDTYFDKVIKYIPADVVAAWVTVNGIVKAATGVPAKTIMWIAFVIGLIITALWTWKQTTAPRQPTAVKQIAISTIAFGIWVVALGTPPFDSLRPLYGSLLLILYTLIVGKFNP